MSTKDIKVAGGYSALAACRTSVKRTNTVVQFIYSHILKFYQNWTYTQARVVESFSVANVQPAIEQRFGPFYCLLYIVSISKISYNMHSYLNVSL